MDFEYHYTEEQERFRAEVGAWLDANLPKELKDAGDWRDLDAAGWEQSKAFQMKLGERGWLAPTDPVERGGGGLSADSALVLIEELGKERDALGPGAGVVLTQDGSQAVGHGGAAGQVSACHIPGSGHSLAPFD